jgi:acyl dehydratase
MRVFQGIDELAGAAGTDLGTTEWLTIDQERIDQFATATGDHQWIHVDPERAAAGPYGRTIAHGLLTLSLIPALTHQLYTVENVAMAINYGFNKVRFAAPVPVGSRVRASARIAEVVKLEGAVQVVVATTVEVEGNAKPAAIVESVARFLGGSV